MTAAPPELELPPLVDVPPVAPPRELLVAVVPPRPVLLVFPPDLEDLLLALEPPDEPVVPPLRLLPPELEAPPSLDEPAEALPADELALLLPFVEPPDDEPSEEDITWLAPPCPPPEVLSPPEPPELLSELRIDPEVSSALHPPRTGKRSKEKTERIVNGTVCLCFSERIYITF